MFAHYRPFMLMFAIAPPRRICYTTRRKDKQAMPMERTFTIDRDLARRAERKLRRYGRTLDDALEYALTLVVAVRGVPPLADRHDPFFDEPNATHLRRAIADMDAKRNIVYHDIIEGAAAAHA